MTCTVVKFLFKIFIFLPIYFFLDSSAWGSHTTHPTIAKPLLGSILPPVQGVLQALPLCTEQLKLEAFHSPPSCAEV
jgi:hypothetical protein